MLILILAFALCFWQADTLFSWLSAPLRAALGAHPTMVFIAPHEAFFTYLRLSMFSAFFLTFPWLLAELWAFIVPGLYEQERRMFTPLLIMGGALFYGGGAFAYLGVFPFAFKFFFGFASDHITAMPSLKESLTLFMRMLFAFGLAFELPMALLLLMHFGAVTAEQLKSNRGYVILIVFVAAAVLTPPDVITQIMLALPMWLLFEFTLLIQHYLTRNKGDKSTSTNPDASV